MRKSILCLWLLSLASVVFSCRHEKTKQVNTAVAATHQISAEQDECNWCGTSEAPQNVSWHAIIPPEGEPGEPLIISGTVFLPDGTTPAEGAIIYIYHTNMEGVYPKKGSEKGNGKYHGYLRGWMKTDSNGKYEFATIRPAPYHSHGGEPAHIHYNVQGPQHPEYWLTALWFSDDPRITDDYLMSVKRSGGFSNVVTLKKDENNVLRGERNIIIERFE